MNIRIRMFLSGVFALLTPFLLFAQQEEFTVEQMYRYSIDLNSASNDALNVELIVPEQVASGSGKDGVKFHFPKIVPGTYEILDYGRFVNGLKAFDKKGAELTVERLDKNTWVITNAKKLGKITYLLEDTWDAKLKHPVFEPSGTSFEEREVYVLNGNACFGFFAGYEAVPYRLSFDRPNDFYGTTSLRRLKDEGDFDTDVFKALNYHELVDNPIMYCEPDTAKFNLGYGVITISVYSPNKLSSAKDIAKKIRPVLEAQNQYLGNILPVDRYAFMLYLSPEGYESGNVGALEHSRSSFFCLTEEKADRISKLVIDIASHEFFHILTPLYVHSEEIHDFDFMVPKMSKHLWLYEGVVEYMAQHMQAKFDLVDDEAFLKVLGDKVRTSYRYKTGLPLEELSLKCLEDDYLKQYNNIYYKGAMAACLLDLKLIQLSDGKMDLQSLLRRLAMIYGQDAPFKDDELFDKIVEITKFEELHDFFAYYIQGSEPFKYNDFLADFGIEYFEKAKIKDISPLGGIENGVIKPDTSYRFYIAKPERMDEFGRDYIKFQQDDIILEWNGSKFNIKTVQGVLITYLNNVKAGDPLEVKILRKNENGEYEQKVLSTTVTKIDVDKEHVFVMKEDATEAQLRLRKIWLDKKEKG